MKRNLLFSTYCLIICLMLFEAQGVMAGSRYQAQPYSQVIIDAQVDIPALEAAHPPIFKATASDLSPEKLAAAIGRDQGTLSRDESGVVWYGPNGIETVIAGDDSCSYYRDSLDMLSTIVSFHRDYQNRFQGQWLRNLNDLDGLAQTEVIASLDRILASCLSEEWDIIAYEVFPIHEQDVQETLNRANVRDNEHYTFSKEDEFYFIQARCHYNGIPMDDIDYELLNEQVIFRTDINALWARDGLYSLRIFGYRQSVEQLRQDADPLTLEQAIDRFAAYFEDILMDRPVRVMEIALVYSAYPTGNECYDIIPAWRFGTSYDGSYVDRFYRINAYTGQFME